jgi:hypothetical protein
MLDHALAMLQRRGRVTYRALKLQFGLDDDHLEAHKEVRRTHGLTVQFHVGLNSGEVVVRGITNDLHMNYSAIGQISLSRGMRAMLRHRKAFILGTALLIMAIAGSLLAQPAIVTCPPAGMTR